MKTLVIVLSSFIIIIGGFGTYKITSESNAISKLQEINTQLSEQIKKDNLAIQSDKTIINGIMNSNLNNANAALANTTSQISTPHLTTSNLRIIGSGSSVFVTGNVTNTGTGASYLNVINVTVYSKDGNVLGTGQTEGPSLPAGGTSGFQVRVAMIDTTTPIDHAVANVS